MSFEPLLGNDQLKENLARSLGRGHVSHFYLISGPQGSGKHTLARLLAAAIQCRGADKPCLQCPACRKVIADTHPDFITVDDPEKKTVPVDLIRQARTDIYIQPNEADYKIYQFPRAQDMGLPGQNALLKVLEEPPKYGVFLLLTDNPDKLLPTVRSRCTELKMQALPEKLLKAELARRFPKAQPEDLSAAVMRSGGILGQAVTMLEGGAVSPQTESLVEALCRRDLMLMMQTLVPMEKLKRDALADILTEWLILMEDALACRSGMQTVSPYSRRLAEAKSSQALCTAIAHLKKCAEYNGNNVSPAAICGYLEWKLRI